MLCYSDRTGALSSRALHALPYKLQSVIHLVFQKCSKGSDCTRAWMQNLWSHPQQKKTCRPRRFRSGRYSWIPRNSLRCSGKGTRPSCSRRQRWNMVAVWRRCRACRQSQCCSTPRYRPMYTADGQCLIKSRRSTGWSRMLRTIPESCHRIRARLDR